MKYLKDIDLKNYSSMKIGGTGFEAVLIEKEDDIPEIIEHAKEKNLQIWVIGEGTNTIFAGGEVKKLFLINHIKGFEVVEEKGNHVIVEIGAGENWDKCVERAIENNWSGIEALSAIPGSVGAAPIQNIGAYGTDASEVITEVKVFDILNNQLVWMNKAQCKFGYRDSIFKQNPSKFIVTKVRLKLSKSAPKIPEYTQVKEYFRTKEPSLKEIRNAITEIRWSKLPNPNVIPNSGSFFKNPVITSEKYHNLKKLYPEIKGFENTNDTYKLSAGWLIDFIGLKGECFKEICVYEKHALVLSNPSGKATFKDLKFAETKIKSLIKEKFHVELEREPVICK